MHATRILLLRHGKTQGKPGILYSQQDVPLNEEGWLQTEKLIQGLEPLPLAAVYASDLSRARVAAERLSEKKGLPLVITPKLREIDFGAWSGKHFQELLALPEFRARLSDPERIAPPGGESLRDLAQRAEEVIQEILSHYQGKLVAVFTHGGLIRAVLTRALGAGLKHFFRLHQDYAAVNLIDYYPEGPVVRLVNGPFDLNFKTLLGRECLV